MCVTLCAAFLTNIIQRQDADPTEKNRFLGDSDSDSDCRFDPHQWMNTVVNIPVKASSMEAQWSARMRKRHTDPISCRWSQE